MITLRQLEALYWIVQLGTFERAAARLHTTQSAVSKRIKELEAACRITVFARDRRGAKLTEQGEHVLALGQEMLGLQERILELQGNKEVPARRLRARGDGAVGADLAAAPGDRAAAVLSDAPDRAGGRHEPQPA
jgi:DNA-binding transcriptional LysR family regulator